MEIRSDIQDMNDMDIINSDGSVDLDCARRVHFKILKIEHQIKELEAAMGYHSPQFDAIPTTNGKTIADFCHDIEILSQDAQKLKKLLEVYKKKLCDIFDEIDNKRYSRLMYLHYCDMLDWSTIAKFENISYRRLMFLRKKIISGAPFTRFV